MIYEVSGAHLWSFRRVDAEKKCSSEQTKVVLGEVPRPYPPPVLSIFFMLDQNVDFTKNKIISLIFFFVPNRKFVCILGTCFRLPIEFVLVDKRI